MKILIVTPEAPGTTLGNSITAGRWAKILGNLGHRVSTATEWTGEEYDLLFALHARRSHGVVQEFRQRYQPRFAPARETESWNRLLQELEYT